MNNLCAIRKSKGINQTDLANILGTTQTVISNLETGRTSMSLDFAAKLATALDCSVDDLVKKEE